jgi:hypothetical protein
LTGSQKKKKSTFGQDQRNLTDKLPILPGLNDPAVHGVVRLFTEARFLAVPHDRITPEVTALVTAMTRGLSAGE